MGGQDLPPARGEVVLTPDQARGAVRGLVRRGLVVKDRPAAPGELPHYRIDPAALANAVERAEADAAKDGA